MSNKNPWIVNINGPETLEEYMTWFKSVYGHDAEDDEDFDPIEDLSCEISVVRRDNKCGRESWGWEGENKIIILSVEEVYPEIFDGIVRTADPNKE